ncbi:hypothetical protein [Parasporobacterium paucivorans]|uniref:Cell division protein FtsX n=1 Tax=Parasporobacterium paucivorans DSM 15970 TaxID=1122934 RepID=A0A1M6GWE0_9FIRM|nr:hypothetical protein [Parasporobacterium paucivorans]SHJ14240.1 hypothetical protein SAMN02745691_01411 [Parasporobacterium paucivorans DSM 15970]
MRSLIKNSSTRYIISLIMSFILTLVLTLMTCLIGIYAGFLHDNAVLKRLDSTYFKSLQTVLYDNLESASIPAGIPLETLTDIYPLTMVALDTKAYAEAILAGREYEADSTAVSETLKSNVLSYMQSQSISLTQEQLANLDEFAKQTGADYTDEIKVPFLTYLVQARNIYAPVMMIGIPVSILISILISLFLIRLYHFKHKAVRFLTYSTLSAGLLCIIVPGLVLLTGFYKRINLEPEYFYHFVSGYLSSGIKVFVILGFLWLLVSAFLIGVTASMKKSVK